MFSERLKKLRKEKGWTMDDMAEKVSFAKTTLSGYENGYRKPNFSRLQEIAAVLDTTPDYLIGTTDDPTPRTTDVKDILSKSELTWNGKKLNNEDLEIIRQLLDRMVKEKA